MNTTRNCAVPHVKVNPSYLAQRSACSPKEDAQPLWGLTPTVACTPWVWTISTRCWRSILWWGGRLRAWLWTDWAGFLADPVFSHQQPSNITKERDFRKKDVDNFFFFPFFCQEAKHDSQFKSFWWWLCINICKDKGLFSYFDHNELHTVNIFGKHVLSFNRIEQCKCCFTLCAFCNHHNALNYSCWMDTRTPVGQYVMSVLAYHWLQLSLVRIYTNVSWG